MSREEVNVTNLCYYQAQNCPKIHNIQHEVGRRRGNLPATGYYMRPEEKKIEYCWTVKCIVSKYVATADDSLKNRLKNIDLSSFLKGAMF